MPKEAILIVDDHPTNLKLARLLFAGEGYDVWTAACAREALAVIQERQPELILMDLLLPDTDGLELTRQLKADPATKDIIILALTAFAMKGDDEKAFQAGCDGYVTKPINTQHLLAVVAEHLSRRQASGSMQNDQLAISSAK
jgi:CheY-like chemotaxis protein